KIKQSQPRRRGGCDDTAPTLALLAAPRGGAVSSLGRPGGADMNVHEYQGKEILRRYGLATPRGVPCFSVAEAEDASRKLGGEVWVVKAQIHAGGRGKGGGVKFARSIEEVREHASAILGMSPVTHQTCHECRV